MTSAKSRRGGRGARERILRTATELFAREGIHATGVARLAEAAEVSTRTFYQHFSSKEALIGAYLRYVDTEARSPVEAQLDRTDRTPRERLLALFAEPPAGLVRGCPFHNAAVEAAGEIPEVAELVTAHKTAFTQRIAETAAEAGAHDPDTLARSLAVLFEGARALSTSVDDPTPVRDARHAAEILIDLAIR
jgi:AcrR family transcriptional regulator